MRTTLNTIYARINTNLGKITTGMGKINEQISSGMQMAKLSDEPVNLASALRFRSAIIELDQYTENIQNGNTIITAAESTLTQMKDLALRAKTLAIQATSPGNSVANREAIAEEIRNMHEQAVALANTQINGKYIFGGYRTTGYPADEPMPFMINKGDGYWVNGNAPTKISSPLPASSGYQIAAGELTINGIAVPASTNTAHGAYDIYTDASAEAKANAINGIQDQTGVNAVVEPAQFNALGRVQGGIETKRLTGTVTNNGLGAGDLAINGTAIGIIVPGAVPLNGLNQDEASIAQTAINGQSLTTGVYARLTTLYAGAAATSGATQTVSFDINNVTVSLVTGGVSAASSAADIVNAINAVSQQSGVKASVGDGTNGGIINSIVLHNVIPGNENDIELTNLDAAETALSGLSLGIHSVSNTSNTGEISLESNSAFTITTPGPDDSYLAQLGLRSETNIGQISYGSTPNLKKGDLTINGIPIITTAIVNMDVNNTLLTAINDQSSRTGVKATRDENGVLQLTAIDGRNIHIETSANGEAITQLTGNPLGEEQVAFGSLQLRSERKFILETVDPTVTPGEPGLAALGLTGGSLISGEPDDIAGDGKINVFSIHDQTGSVRYTGDRANDLEIKIGKTNTMTIGENGKTGIMDTTIFSSLKALEDTLLGYNFTEVTGIHTATDTSITLNSKTTGLEPESQLASEDLFAAGSFKVSVLDHDYSPPRETKITIGVDPANDTLSSVTARINGIPHLSAAWVEGHLTIQSDAPRYTIALSDDSSNFLKATGVSFEFMQSDGISQSLDDLDTLMENLSRQVSDFGARANRISVQSQIYSNMILTTKENLSEVQDTDMVKAVLELKAKETAYEAALSSAAKTMQLSLVDYLR